MPPKKKKIAKAKNVWDLAQVSTAPVGSVKVLARPCPILDIVSLGKRKARPDDAVQLCDDGRNHTIRLNIKDGRHKCKASNQKDFEIPWVRPDTTQAEMYEGVKSVVDKFLIGRSDCALLAYGATGSGKTFSMQGPKRAYLKPLDGGPQNTLDQTEGLLQRSLQHIFTVMQRLSKTTTISICAVEIYNEKIRDLLVPFTRKDDPASECEINSLTKAKESNSADVKLMGQFQLRHKDKSDLREVKLHTIGRRGLSRPLFACLMTHPQHLCLNSSDHCLAQLDGIDAKQVSKTATLWLGDLCGAEAYDPVCLPGTCMCATSQAASAAQLLETKSINQSLLAFTSCLKTLWYNQKEGGRAKVPVRDSVLTRILADIMNGVGHLALSVNFSLRDCEVESTRRTLRFAEQVAELRFEGGMRVQQTVELDGGAAPALQEDDTDANAAGAAMLASERQACDRQKLLEYPELVRQRDQLDKEIKMMKLTSVEREDHAYQEGYDEGFREAEQQHNSGEADAELLQLANQDWQQRLEEAVHQAKENMHTQMCTHVEEVTEKGFQRESKLTMEIAALRGRLRRAGLLDEGPRMPRKTLVRASRQSDSDDDDEDDDAVSQGSLDRPTTIAEEEEEGEAGAEEDEVLVGDEGPAVSGADRSASGSNGANVDEVGEDERLAATETPVAGEGHYDVPEGAVQSHRGGGMAISITEVAGAPLEGFPLAGQQEDGRVSVARHQEVDAVRKWREAQEALESERHKRETLDVEVRKLRAQVQNLEVVAGDLEVECKLREAQVAEQSELSQKLLALQQENDALKAAAAVPESVRAGSPREASAQEVQAGPQLQECMETVADAGPDEQSDDPDSPDAEISQLRYAAVLQEAMAEATDSEEDGVPNAAPPGVFLKDAHDEEGSGAAGSGAESPAAAPLEDAPTADVASPVCEDPPLEDINPSIAPPPESPAGQPASPPLPQWAGPACADASGDGGVAVDTQACGGGKTGLAEGGQDQSPAPDAGVWCGATEPADNTQAALRPDVMHGGLGAAAKSLWVKRAAPPVERTMLQRLLAGVPLPKENPGMVDVLPGIGREFGREFDAAPTKPMRRNTRAARQRRHDDVENVLQELVQGHPGDENERIQVGKKGRWTRQAKNRTIAKSAADSASDAPVPARALRSRRNC